MTDRKQLLEEFLSAATVDEEVFALRLDYRALLIAVDGITPGSGDDSSESLLTAAEAAATRALQDHRAEDLPAIASWRAAYRAFGAKPQRTRNSLEALTRRAVTGLPRVNRLTDIYNAISVLHGIPLGGEDLDRYDGAPHLTRAAGGEWFDTVADGAPAVENPEPGEVIWRDATGVTCRRWNWRQGTRTQLTDTTTRALFILDALDPITDEALSLATQDLTEQLVRLGPNVVVAGRTLTANP